MKKMDAFRQAIAETGNATDEELSAYIEQRFGLTIDPLHIRLFRASYHDLQRLHRLRQEKRFASLATSPIQAESMR